MTTGLIHGNPVCMDDERYRCFVLYAWYTIPLYASDLVWMSTFLVELSAFSLL